MKILKLRIANRVDITRLFSASIRGGCEVTRMLVP